MNKLGVSPRLIILCLTFIGLPALVNAGTSSITISCPEPNDVYVTGKFNISSKDKTPENKISLSAPISGEGGSAGMNSTFASMMFSTSKKVVECRYNMTNVETHGSVLLSTVYYYPANVSSIASSPAVGGVWQPGTGMTFQTCQGDKASDCKVTITVVNP